MEENRSFTGRARRRTTRRSVLVVDRVSRLVITVGGIGTILAVMGVGAFLLWVVLPLFLPAKVSELKSFSGQWSQPPQYLHVDEHQVLCWVLLPSGELQLLRLDRGEPLSSTQLYPAGEMTSASFLGVGDTVIFGLRNGVVGQARIGFESEVRDPDQLPETVRDEILQAPPGTPVYWGESAVQLTPQRQVRITRLRVEQGAETRISDRPVWRVCHVVRSGGPLIVALTEEQDEARLRLVAISGEERQNFLTGETTMELAAPRELPFAALSDELPRHLAISGSGEDVYVGWESGELLRVRIADPPFVAETGRLVAEGTTLTTLGFILGHTTLVWGDSDGRVRAGFPVRLEELDRDGVPGLEHGPAATTQLVTTKLLPGGRAPATVLGPSARSRLLLIGFADGFVRLTNVTSAAELLSFRLPEGEELVELRMAPKEDGLIVLTRRGIFHGRLDPRYPEASFRALFLPVWYEGYAEPQHMWQSSSASDDFEPKLGLYPLIFGTLKATLYSMLFGAPLALLGAIFTSEFLHPRTRAVVKPTIELMASLPSVVLGFLAALVFAPFLEKVVPATLAVGIAMPVVFLLGAYGWQLLPARTTLILERFRFAFLVVVMPLGLVLAAGLGPVIENLLFAGDVKGWLAWEPGSGRPRFADATGGWMLLWLPLATFVTVWLMQRFAGPWMRERAARWQRRRLAVADLGRFLAGAALALAIAFAVSALCNALGWDPRGSYVDTFVQRNALVVGFVMGFAVIPIIYTISEDALSTVPEHLRSASLGAGATQWQTAMRIIIPTAMSGLFSAMMVGLGRAVGETMIVLMAAGNTPVMEWNVFEGFRTLSANIAVELPEAVQGSSHYRTLFLAALVLFLMTFVVNTVAEIIRLRFRKRAYQL